MTRRSPRAGGSGQERPRLAGKEPGAYRATTMFVHFRETPYGLAMSLVENRRENGRICHGHVASFQWSRRRSNPHHRSPSHVH